MGALNAERAKTVLIAVGGAAVLGAGIACLVHFIKKKKAEQDIPEEPEQDWSEVGKVIPKGADLEPVEDISEEADSDEDGDGLKIVPDANGGISLEDAVKKYVGDEQDILVEITQEEFLALPKDDQHCYTYFVLDDILSGPDEEIGDVDPEEDIFKVGVNAAMASEENAVYIKNTVTGEGSEIIKSSDNYLEVYQEIMEKLHMDTPTEEDDG